MVHFYAAQLFIFWNEYVTFEPNKNQLLTIKDDYAQKNLTTSLCIYNAYGKVLVCGRRHVVAHDVKQDLCRYEETGIEINDRGYL